MKIESATELASICDILRAKGVTEFSIDGVSVKLGIQTQPEVKELGASDTEQCRCGHKIYMHNEHGDCIGGCSNEACEGMAG